MRSWKCSFHLVLMESLSLKRFWMSWISMRCWISFSLVHQPFVLYVMDPPIRLCIGLLMNMFLGNGGGVILTSAESFPLTMDEVFGFLCHFIKPMLVFLGYVPNSFLTRSKDSWLECPPVFPHTFWKVCQHLLTVVLKKNVTFGDPQDIYIYFMPDLLPPQWSFWDNLNVHDRMNGMVTSSGFVSAGKVFCDLNIRVVIGMDNDIINQVLVLQTWVLPAHHMLFLLAEQGVGNNMVMLRALTQKDNSIEVSLPHSVFP